VSSKIVPFPRSAESIDGIPDRDIKVIEVDGLGREPRVGAHRAGRFLRGPIPLADLEKASVAGGKALALFLAVHHQSALRLSRTVKLPGSLLAGFGIGRTRAADALRRLEAVGLVAVERRGKSKPVITLLTSANTRGGRIS
jgi:hypothetical protein